MRNTDLYKVIKLPIRTITSAKYDLQLNKSVINSEFVIREADNQMLRLIRMVSQDDSEFNKYIIFVDIKKDKKKREVIETLVNDGFMFNGHKFKVSESSASMLRNATMSFVREDIYDELNKKVLMGIDISKEMVISKFMAYKGLFYSSSFHLNNYIPKIIVVDDYETIVKDNHVKYLVDKDAQYTVRDEDGNPTGEIIDYTYKDVVEGHVDLGVNLFDGAGIMHPEIMRKIKLELSHKDINSKSLMIRAPYIKGVVHEIDYPQFFKERGVKMIKDIFGNWHRSDDVMMIITKSMYKGIKYFGYEKEDWVKYWTEFYKHGHCISISKWWYSFEDEPIMSRMNYQVLQTLDLDYDDFSSLADYSLEWVLNVMSGDIVSMYGFLGLLGGKHNNPRNEYARAMLKNNHMRFDPHIRKYLYNSIKKKINDMKIGRIYVEGCFKVMAPDLIMMMEHIGGLELIGAIPKDGFYAVNKNGVMKGTHYFGRNPHITRGENILLDGTENDDLNKYCNLPNTVMINCHGIESYRGQGWDYDGDIIFVTKNETMIKGSKYVVPVVNVDDGVVAKKVKLNSENIINTTLLGMDSWVGDYSNMGTCYLNKIAKTEDGHIRNNKNVEILSVACGVDLDKVKTGVGFKLNKGIIKFAKPYPYFLKFKDDPYYKKLKNFNHSHSNMNRMAKDIDKWEKQINKHVNQINKGIEFDYTIMLKKDFQLDAKILNQIKTIFIEFNKDMQILQRRSKQTNYYYKTIDEIDQTDDVKINWGYYYEEYRNRLLEIVPDIQELASYLVITVYEFHPKKSKKFAWALAEDGILKNLEQQDEVYLPVRDDDGEYEYLGKNYRLELQ